MLSRKLIGLLVVLSFSGTLSAQTAPPKPKPGKKPAAVAKKPVPKTAEPAPAPAPAPPPSDVQILTKYITGAQISENKTYIKGARQRFEFPGITMITQCDLKRSLQIHDATKQYMVVSTEMPASAPPAAIPDPQASAMALMGNPGATPPTPPKPQGGVIAETITLTDTGERKQMFGLEARHIKTAIVRQPGANACDTKSSTVETDGWYADLPDYVSCPSLSTPPPPPPPSGQQACTDRVVTQQAGDAKLGFALSTMVTTTVTDGKDKDKDKDKNKDTDVTTMSMEVTDLKVTSLDNALFDVPPGYAEVKNYKALLPSIANGGSLADAVFGSITDGTSSVAPKNPGVIRIGIVNPTNKSGREVSDPTLIGSLLAAFTKKPFEGLPVSGATAAELDRDGAAKACDYILVSEIAELKTSKPNKVGGMLRKVSGDANAPTEIHEARIDYKLYAVGDPTKPKVTSSMKASSGGGFGVGSALRLAAFAGSMYLTMGMGSGMMMGMLGQNSSLAALGGMGGGPMMGRMNPGMSAAMSMMSQAQMMGGMGMPTGAAGMGMGMGGDPSGQKAAETVQEALTKTGKQVAEELKKAKSPAAAEKK